MSSIGSTEEEETAKMLIPTKLTTTTTKSSVTTVTLANPADQLEAASEALYNATENNYRAGFLNWGSPGVSSPGEYRDVTPLFVNSGARDNKITFRSDAPDVVHAGGGNDEINAGGAATRSMAAAATTR